MRYFRVAYSHLSSNSLVVRALLDRSDNNKLFVLKESAKKAAAEIKEKTGFNCKVGNLALNWIQSGYVAANKKKCKS
jgi:hypothetical protein